MYAHICMVFFRSALHNTRTKNVKTKKNNNNRKKKQEHTQRYVCACSCIRTCICVSWLVFILSYLLLMELELESKWEWMRYVQHWFVEKSTSPLIIAMNVHFNDGIHIWQSLWIETKLMSIELKKKKKVSLARTCMHWLVHVSNRSDRVTNSMRIS